MKWTRVLIYLPYIHLTRSSKVSRGHWKSFAWPCHCAITHYELFDKSLFLVENSSCQKIFYVFGQKVPGQITAIILIDTAWSYNFVMYEKKIRSLQNLISYYTSHFDLRIHQIAFILLHHLY